MNARKNLYQAVEKLVQERPLEKISVEEILKEAEVSRRTFYKYFTDKYHLANSLYEQHVTEKILTNYDGQNWKEILTEIMIFIQENIRYYQQLKKYRGQGSFWDFLMNYSFKFHYSVYKQNMGSKELTPVQINDVWYVVGGNMKILEKWMESSYSMPIDELVEGILSHTDPRFFQIEKQKE